MAKYQNIIKQITYLGFFLVAMFAVKSFHDAVPDQIYVNMGEELSYDFLEELFSEQVLKNDLNDGYPVNQKAFDQFFVDPSGGTSQEGFSASSEDGVRVDVMIRWPKGEELDRVKELIGTLTLPSDVESMLKEAVCTTGEKVLRGEMTPQEGADEIGQKMELYFAE